MSADPRRGLMLHWNETLQSNWEAARGRLALLRKKLLLLVMVFRRKLQSYMKGSHHLCFGVEGRRALPGTAGSRHLLL